MKWNLWVLRMDYKDNGLHSDTAKTICKMGSKGRNFWDNKMLLFENENSSKCWTCSIFGYWHHIKTKLSVATVNISTPTVLSERTDAEENAS